MAGYYGGTGNPQGASPFNISQGMGSGLTRRTVRGVSGGLPIYEDQYGGLTARDEKEITLAPINYRRDVFNRTMPYIDRAFANMGDTSLSTAMIGGQNTPLRPLPQDSIWNAQQIQEQVNNARAMGDQGAQARMDDLSGDLASRGYGANSPLAMALRQGVQSTTAASNADQERQIRWDAAQGNAGQALNVGRLAQQQWSDFNQSEIERRRTQLDGFINNQRNMTALISAIAGLG